jgi:hypothetical protein
MVTSSEDSGQQNSRSRAWSAPSVVPRDSGTGQQIAQMEKLVAGEVSGPEFARAWLAARRQALDNAERVREPFERILYEVFYLLDDYVIDPDLRGPHDISDKSLTQRVVAALNRLNALEAPE